MRRALLAVTAVVLTGCVGTMRSYQMPLTPSEAQLVFPALVATAQGMGLESTLGSDRVFVSYENGDQLIWVAEPQRFVLWLNLVKKGLPQDQLDVSYRELKVKADQIWELAIETRQRNNIGAAVVVGQPPAASGPAPVAVRETSRAAPPPGNGPCRYGTDCGSGQFCREWDNGQKFCMGNGAHGSVCAYGTDCGPGLFCRDRGGAGKTCN